MTEPEVVQRVHRFLKRKGLRAHPVVRLYTDAHPSLLPHTDLRPFQRFILDVGDFVAHPDLVGQLGDGETIFAVEAKGASDLLKGLAQAEVYQIGFHQVFLAADANALGTAMLRLARTKNVGVLAVDAGDVRLAYLPEPRLPWRDPYRFVARQMESVVQVTGQQTFTYNLPTHYLAWAVALEPDRWYTRDELPEAVDGYPMPKSWLPALRGAVKLGLVREDGRRAKLTPVGEAVKEILATSLEDWGEVHVRAKSAPLVDHEPRAAAALRMLLLQDRMVKLVVQGLRRCPSRQATFDELARICDRIDHARALIFFFNPETLHEITDDRGAVCWDRVAGHHYRSSMFYQYKSILKHAGILRDTGLGGSSAKHYDPKRDVWALR